MRRAMAEAEVGDDVLDGDPTVRLLEQTAARWLGKDGALMDGAFGIEGDASCFVFFGAAGVDLVCCSANKSLASDFVSPLAT